MRRVSSGDLRRFVPNITTGMGMKYQQVPGDQDSPLLVKESNWYLSIIDKTIGIWGNNDAFPFYIFVKYVTVFTLTWNLRRGNIFSVPVTKKELWPRYLEFSILFLLLLWYLCPVETNLQTAQEKLAGAEKFGFLYVVINLIYLIEELIIFLFCC